MDFKLGRGPWHTILEGFFEGHEIEILQNPESALLVIVFDKQNEGRIGALVQCFIVFSAEGEMHVLLDKARTESIAIIKHSKGTTHRFFLLSAQPAYVDYGEEAVQKETDFQLDRIAGNARIIRGMATAADTKLKDLHLCNEETQKAFFSQPLALALLLATDTGEKKEASQRAGKNLEIQTDGTVLIGLGKDGKPIKEPLALLEKTIVEEGSEEERMHAVRVLAESALLSKATVILFDQKKSFTGLSTPTAETRELQKFGIEFEPVGFPAKELSVPLDVGVDVSLINPKGITELFGLGEGEAGKAFEKAFENTKAESLQEIINAAEAKKTDESGYQAARAVRVLKLLDSMYPKLFDGKNDIPEITREWVKGLGRAAIINLEKKEDRIMLLVAHSIAKGMLAHFQEKGKSRALRAMVFFPKADVLFSSAADNILSKEISETMARLKDYGVGFLLEAERASAISQGMRKLSEATISIVAGNDAGVQLKGKRNYRAKIRPTLSKS